MSKARNAAYAEEKAEVEVLKGQVAKHDDLSKRLKGVQLRLQGDGRSVSESLGPIEDNTRGHQTFSDNIDKLIVHIDKMLVSGQDKSREEQIIMAGPKRAGLNEYIACMKRIDRYLEQLASSKMRVQQQTVGDYNVLLSEGISRLEELFKEMIAETSTTHIEPLRFLTKGKEFPMFTPERTVELKSIQTTLSTPSARALSYNQKENIAIRIFADLRSNYLANSLQTMAMASISTSRRQNSEEPYRPNTSGIGPYTNAMFEIFKSEFKMVNSIFASDDTTLVLDTTCRKAFSDLAKTIRELNLQVKNSITTDCFLGYEIIELVNNLSQRLSTESPAWKLPFADALKPVRDTAKSSLPELLDDQKRRINLLLSLPSDAAAIPFTKETMTRLQTMTSYTRCLSSLLGSMGDGNWTSAASVHSTNSSASLPSLRSLDVGADGGAMLSHYILDTLELHFTTIEARSRMLHKSKAVTGVFLHNTLAVMERMVRSSDLASLLSSNSTASNKMENWRKKAVATYMDLWRDPSSALLDVVYTNRASANRPASAASLPSTDIVKNLSSKDKDAIKEKFKHFNSSFDDAIRRHKELLPAMEREVRSNLAREINNMIEPLYTRFFDKYEALDRGRGKYIRYDKGTLSSILAGLG